MPLFGRSQKSPQELVKQLRDAVSALSKGDKGDKKVEKILSSLEKMFGVPPSLTFIHDGGHIRGFHKANNFLAALRVASEDVSKCLASIKALMNQSAEQDSQSEFLAQLGHEMYSANLLLILIQNLSKIDFEGRKDVVHIFNNLLRQQIGTRTPTVEHICQHQEILIELMKGYENKEIALRCGMMLRECCRFEALSKIMLYAENFFDFFSYVEVSTFDIASDAFSTFKDLLTKHKMLSAEFLENNYDKVFDAYLTLLNSENYVTRRQALKLLGELLLDRHNFTVMTKYISNPDNLKLMMNMLREKSRNIQFEAFHVFKVFVANPNKPRPIMEILLRNKEKLVDFLTKFHTDRSEDEQFNDEKAYLIKQIKELKPPEDS